VNAKAAVDLAQRWQNVPPLAAPIEIVQDFGSAGIEIPDNTPAGINTRFSVTAPSNFIIEHVEIETDITHTFIGDLALTLTAPGGMVSKLMLANGLAHDPSATYEGWRFRTVADWGEHPSGTWILNTSDNYELDTGVLKNATLRIYGYLGSTAVQNDWSLYQ
jgi:subtilisin-like proprotein convertase family protein